MSDENAQVFETVQDSVPETDASESTGVELDENGQPIEGDEAGGDHGDELAEGELEAKSKDPWYKRRIDELTRDKHEARRLAERYEKMIEQMQSQGQKAPEQTKTPEIQPPNPNDFAGGQYDPRYMEAMLQYTRQSAVMEAKQAIAQEYEQRQAQQAFMAAQAKLETSEAAARAKFADYDAVIEGITSDARLAQNPTIRQALLGMDNGPEIAYTLGKNLDVAYEIASMNPIQAGMRLAELINRAPRRTGNAPIPPKPINGAGRHVGYQKPLSEMTTAEYIAARNAEEMAKRTAHLKR